MSGERSPSGAVAEKLIDALALDETIAAELRSLGSSEYRSGFETTPIRLPTAD